MKKGKILVVGVLTTTLAFASSVTATYAWFALETQQKDQIMNFGVADVSSDAVLEMGYYDVNGNAVYPTEENPFKFDQAGLDKAFGPAGYDSSKPLDPVTGLSSTLVEGRPLLTSSYKGGMDPSTFLYPDGSRAEGVGTYFQFDFAFRCNMPCWVYLAPSSHVTPGDNSNKYDHDTGIELDEDKLNQAVHALRVRFTSKEDNEVLDFVTAPTVNPSKEGQNLAREEGKKLNQVYYGGAASLTENSGFYDNVDGEEIIYGLKKGQEKLFLDAPGDGVPVSNGDFLHAGHASGVKVADVAKLKQLGSIEKEDAYAFDEMTLEEGAGQTSSPYLLSLSPGISQRLVVTVYLEGWDPYCTNDIGQAAMSLDLVFTGLVH